MGWLTGAVDALKLITNGPGPPNRGDSGNGASRSSMLGCRISPLDGLAIMILPRRVRVFGRILTKLAE
jgi:hypothetical protein